MDWLRENWFWVFVIGLFVWMHTKMHGGHGGHSGHGGHAGHGGWGGSHQEEDAHSSDRREESDDQY